jgi:hypothetical protein
VKIFFYMGRNPENKSGVSWKIWKIQRKAKTVTTWWGAAKIHNRKVIAIRALQTKTLPPFPSIEAAAADEAQRIRSKRLKGYESIWIS